MKSLVNMINESKFIEMINVDFDTVVSDMVNNKVIIATSNGSTKINKPTKNEAISFLENDVIMEYFFDWDKYYNEFGSNSIDGKNMKQHFLKNELQKFKKDFDKYFCYIKSFYQKDVSVLIPKDKFEYHKTWKKY